MDEESHDSTGNVYNGKIMMSSVAVLIVAWFVVVLFHVYARWFGRRLHHLNRRRPATVVSSQGLDVCIMNSLPTFIYDSKSQESPLECAVCLSEFEDNETGRILPECKHCFHVDCIDMWLQSHCDCPICRTQVKVQATSNPVEPIENPHERIVSIRVPEDTGSGSSSGLHIYFISY
ncbi:hypothetical protein Pfo_006122 [Paulownia fortunei]|nr:hypothetical protein Pfo_006122 [Paulownia fortunei]